MTNTNVPTVIENREEKAISVFSNAGSFETAQRMARALSSSALVPQNYQGEKGFSNCLIALEVAQRTGSSIMAVTQNLNIIHGKPSWSSNYIIGAINASGRFRTKLKFKFEDRGQKKVDYSYWVGEKPNRTKKDASITVRDKVCVAYATDHDGDQIVGPEVSVEMAVKEGWYTKSDSKWPTMTDLMLSYRAAAFFGRLYTPEILLGMKTEDEARDVTEIDSVPDSTPNNAVQTLNEKIKKVTKKQTKTVEAEPVIIDQKDPEPEAKPIDVPKSEENKIQTAGEEFF